MIDLAGTPHVLPNNGELRQILEPVLSGQGAKAARISVLSRKPSGYSSSFFIEEIEAQLEDGRTFELILKNFSRNAMLEEARKVRQAPVFDPGREIFVYRSILSRHQCGTASLVAEQFDPESERFWLILEKVPGAQLCHIGDFEIWLLVARYLARLHHSFRHTIHDLKVQVPLLRHDRQFYELWPARALTFGKVINSSSRLMLEQIAKRYSRVTDRLLALPNTLLHGDFNASNILISRQSGNVRICPIDWEMAAVGTGLTDLASLVSGQWSEAQRHALVAAYVEETISHTGHAPDTGHLLKNLKYCRLHLAMQWLGWSENWTPPPEQHQDWLAQVVTLASELDLV